jgi:hypothetical protein
VVGIIASVSHPFCAACNRTRLTADGQIRSCLFTTEETDLRGLLRGGADDTVLTTYLISSRDRIVDHHGAGPTNSCRMTGPAQRLSSSRLRLDTGGFARTDLLVARPMMNASVKPIRVCGWSSGVAVSIGIGIGIGG